MKHSNKKGGIMQSLKTIRKDDKTYLLVELPEENMKALEELASAETRKEVIDAFIVSCNKSCEANFHAVLTMTCMNVLVEAGKLELQHADRIMSDIKNVIDMYAQTIVKCEQEVYRIAVNEKLVTKLPPHLVITILKAFSDYINLTKCETCEKKVDCVVYEIAKTIKGGVA